MDDDDDGPNKDDDRARMKEQLVAAAQPTIRGFYIPKVNTAYAGSLLRKDVIQQLFHAFNKIEKKARFQLTELMQEQ